MKNCLLRSFQALLVFSLAFTLTNCGNLDNPLEELSGGGSGGSGDGGGSSTINATDIKLDQTLKVIKLGGDALTITATVTPSDANYTWESDATAIATVDETGKVTPVGVGIATITAKSGDVTATCKIFVGNEVDLSAKIEDYEVKDFDILKNELNNAYALTIPDGYHVAFAGLTTTKTVTCSGDATIYLTDGSTNTVNVSTANKAGIKVGPTDKTLTIEAETEGTGTLTAKGGINGAGIGTNQDETGGNITINGGNVEARGGSDAAGIGTGDTESGNNACGDITINGGTVTALGGYAAAGIGTGCAGAHTQSTCGAITISANVTKVTAKRGDLAPKIIGTGHEGSYATQTCGKIKFGTAEVYDGASTWDTSIVFNTNGDYGPYGGLNLNISKTTNDHDTWTLTPAP